MSTPRAATTELFQLIDEEVIQLLQLVSQVDDDKINKIPYKNSWTAAQLVNHVTKSTVGVAQAIGAPSKPASRDAGERIPELKKTFLDFLHKMKSPDTIVPDDGPFEIISLTHVLQKAFNALQENATKNNLNEIVEDLPLGEITKLELLYFVLYHTKRHVHQMRKIIDALPNN